MSKIGFGCVALTQHTFQKDALAILEMAYDKGITYFDTAPLYGQGYSEKILGKFIQGKRNQVTIATKFGLGNLTSKTLSPKLALPLHHLMKKIRKPIAIQEIKNTGSLSIPYRIINKKLIEKSITNSLRSLKTDHINNYLLHEALPSFLTDEALLYLLSLKEQKIIGQLGIASGFTNLKNLGEIPHFDILQYEGSLSTAENYNFNNEYRTKTHIHHSVLKQLKQLIIKDISQKDFAGWLLLNALNQDTAKHVLFSTTNKENLAHNLKVIEDNKHLNANTIKEIITDALS